MSIDYAGACPYCDEPVALSDLTNGQPDPVMPMTCHRRRRAGSVSRGPCGLRRDHARAADRTGPVRSRRRPARRAQSVRSGPRLVGVVGVRCDRHAMLREHAGDRRDTEPDPVVVNEGDYHGKRGSSSRANNDEAAKRISLARFNS